MSSDPQRVKAGKAGRRKTPWNLFPHCETRKAILAFGKGKKRRAAAEAIAKMREKKS